MEEYYLNSINKCISFMDKLKEIPHWSYHLFYIGNYSFEFYYNYDIKEIHYYFGSNYYYDNYNYYNEIVKNIKYPINTIWIYYNYEYGLNSNGECEYVSFEKYNINNIINNP